MDFIDLLVLGGLIAIVVFLRRLLEDYHRAEGKAKTDIEREQLRRESNLWLILWVVFLVILAVFVLNQCSAML